MSFIQYVVSPKGRKQLLQILLVNLGIVIFFWLILRWYTDHGEQIAVPDLKGLSLEEATAALDERGLSLLVVDSIYDEKADGGKVVEQSPVPESKVKEGRQVFVTIYRFEPPQETINIKEGDYAQVAIIKLKNKGIRFDIVEVPNGNMVGSVISITHKGKKIKPGDAIARGEKVTLSVGIASNATIPLPNLQGLTYQQAMTILDSLQLMGQAFFDTEPLSTQDSALFRVCRQDPPFEADAAGVPPGRIIDFWLSNTPCQADSLD
jgi:eukaryotic-like serine/threonine-protein kinase